MLVPKVRSEHERWSEEYVNWNGLPVSADFITPESSFLLAKAKLCNYKVQIHWKLSCQWPVIAGGFAGARCPPLKLLREFEHPYKPALKGNGSMRVRRLQRPPAAGHGGNVTLGFPFLRCTPPPSSSLFTRTRQYMFVDWGCSHGVNTGSSVLIYQYTLKFYIQCRNRRKPATSSFRPETS
jgi:hypothetical protein